MDHQARVKEIAIQKSPLELFNSVSDRDYSFFLDSGMSHKRLGRYSYIGFDPFIIFRSKGGNVEITKDGKTKKVKGNPFDILEAIIKDYKIQESTIPFTGGAVGFFGYDLKDLLYKLPQTATDDIGMWDCILGFYDSVLIFDNLRRNWYLSSCGFTGEDYRDDVERITSSSKEDVENADGIQEYRSNFTRVEYLRTVERVKEYIAAGDIYQANLSQRLEARADMKPWVLYKRLRRINPAPFAAFLNFRDVVVVSASPERFFRVEKGRIETRPMKGTRPRGTNSEEDEILGNELKGSGKDKAEHVMIVDLERNDIGKICKFGSVKVSEFEIIEEYSTVFQMVSTVEGILRDDVNQVDCLRAMFPGGSITGAPKVRAMEIIEELEPTKRGLYTGSIGYLGFNGNIDLSIVIRTFIIRDNKAYFQVGGGIVADSDPEAEYRETMDKSKALIDALKG